MGEAVSRDVTQRMMLPYLRPVPVSKPKRSRIFKLATFAVPSVTAGSFKPKKLIERGHGRRNPTVAFLRGFTQFDLAVKQPGRRYGPPPLSGNCNPGSPTPKGRRTAKLAEKHARQESGR